MNRTTSAGIEGFNLNVPTFFPQDTSSTISFVVYTLFFAFALSVFYDNVLYPRVSTLGRFWKEQAWTANPTEWFWNLKAQIRSLKEGQVMLNEGYQTYSKNEKAFVFPMMGNRRHLVLPPTEIRNLLSKPGNELDQHQPHEEATHDKYTIRNKLMKEDGYHLDIVRRELTRKLPMMTNDVYNELCYGLRTLWSDSTTEWNTVKVHPTNMRIVSRAANRVFAGTKLCRNDEYLEHSKLFSQGVFMGAQLIGMFPKWMRPVVAPIIAYPNRKNSAICHKHAIPVIAERLHHTFKKVQDPSYEWEQPTDALQWLVETALEKENPAERDPAQISVRLLQLNMVAIHTTSLVMSNTMLDLYSSPKAKEYLAGLREECERVLKKYGGEWSKDAVNELVRVDSVIRETMRFTGLGALGLQRLVIAPEGVDFGHGIHVPAGVTVAMPIHDMHRDDSIYPDANTYDPFRFSAPREAYEATHDKDLQATLEHKNQSLITVSDSFLGFGHGRHACPGRFFAAQEMKLMLAEIIMNYDVQPVGDGRPPNQAILVSSSPPADAEFRVKRRA